MTKRKYCKGDLVVNIAELSNYNSFLYIDGKVWHAGWWGSLQYSLLQNYIRQKRVWFAENIGGSNVEVKKMEKKTKED